MNRIKPKRHIKPTPENRKELVDLIVYGLAETNDRFESGYLDDVASVNKCIRERNTSALGIGMGFAFFNLMGKSINLILEKKDSGWESVNQAYSYMYWGWEIQHHDSVRENISFDCPTQCESSQIIMHALSLCSESEEISNWFASFLRNLISMGGAEAIGYEDQDFLEFYNLLLWSQINEKWAPKQLVTTKLKNYERLLASTFELEKFNDALVDYCDFRLARAFQFDSVLASKPRKPSDFMFLYEQHWIAVFPFELVALKKIYKKIFGNELSMEVNHPLLKLGFLDIPKIKLTEDDFTKSIVDFGKEEFGKNWMPLSEINILN